MAREKRHVTMVLSVKGESYINASDEADYYSVLTDIIQIQYEGSINLKITLFKCKWFDPLIGRGTRRSNGESKENHFRRI